jgi:hypothetical protein
VNRKLARYRPTCPGASVNKRADPRWRGYAPQPGNRSTTTVEPLDAQPQADVTRPLNTPTQHLVVALVAGRLVSNHFVNDHVACRNYKGKHRRTVQATADVRVRRTTCCRAPPNPYPLDRDHNSP